MFVFLHHSFINESFTEYIGANLDSIIPSQQRNDKKPNLKGLCHDSPVNFLYFCQLLALNRYGTQSKQRNYM